MITIAQIAGWLAPWQKWYDGSKLVSGTVSAAHLVSLLFSGGLAVAADRATLRAMRSDAAERTRHLKELGQVHRPVLIAMAFLLVTGILLALADFETFVKAPAFWIKLVLVALLLANGAFLARTEATLRRAPDLMPARLWRRLGISTWLSLGLWTATLVAGVALVNAA